MAASTSLHVGADFSTLKSLLAARNQFQNEHKVTPMLKWALRWTTNLCELQRICYGEEKGMKRTSAVESSLRQSKCDLIQKLLAKLDSMAEQGKITNKTCSDLTEYAVITVVKVKNIKPELNRQ
ncbi:ELMO domain-containing protein 1 [Nymphon striatum]|nr:ELMO domain-containing protein 1 [Nymphon striatum]